MALIGAAGRGNPGLAALFRGEPLFAFFPYILAGTWRPDNRYAPPHGSRGHVAASAARASRAGCCSGIHRLLRVFGLGDLCLPDPAVRDYPLASSGRPCAGAAARVRHADVASARDRDLYGGHTGAWYPAASVAGAAGHIRMPNTSS